MMIAEGSPVGEQGDSSDDELQPVEFLYKKRSEHLVLTPRRGVAPPDAEESPRTPAQESPRKGRRRKKTKYALNSLLTERYDEESREKNIEEMEKKLQGSISRGGILSLMESEKHSEEQASENEDESQKAANEYVHDFPSFPPGQSFFNQECMLTEPRLPPLPNFFESFCHVNGTDDNQTPEERTKIHYMVIRTLMSNEWLCTWDESNSLPEDVYSWCFERMCFDGDAMVSQLCYEFLLAANHWRKEAGIEPKFVVTLPRFAVILMKCSAMQSAIESIIASCSLPPEEKSFSLNVKAACIPGQLNTTHFFKLLQLCIANYKQHYTLPGLRCIAWTCLTLMLDQQMQRYQHLLQHVVRTILDSYDEDVAAEEVIALARTFPAKKFHHHNVVHLVEMLPLTTRGNYLRSLMSFIALKCLTSASFEVGDHLAVVKEETIKNSLLVLKTLELSNPECDYYQANSVLGLLYSAITAASEIHQKQQNGVTQLVSALMRANLKIKDASGAFLNRSKVKATILKITSLLSLAANGRNLLAASEDEPFQQTRLSFNPRKIEVISNGISPGNQAPNHDEEVNSSLEDLPPL